MRGREVGELLVELDPRDIVRQVEDNRNDLLLRELILILLVAAVISGVVGEPKDSIAIVVIAGDRDFRRLVIPVLVTALLRRERDVGARGSDGVA